MEFSPNNPIVRLCLQGMAMEDAGKPAEAANIFMQAWNEAANEFEKFLAAWYVARHQPSAVEELKWLETALQLAMKVDDDSVRSAYPSLFFKIADCYERMGDAEQANKNRDQAIAFQFKPSDKGPFYHGTRAHLQIGDLLTAGNRSNYQPDLVMNHIYFTALPNGAGLAAALAQGEGDERVYIVEPVGSFENDPNVTDKKFPGNPTRSYRTREPLKVIGEITEWVRQSPEDIRKWRERLANNKGEIIN